MGRTIHSLQTKKRAKREKFFGFPRVRQKARWRTGVQSAARPRANNTWHVEIGGAHPRWAAKHKAPMRDLTQAGSRLPIEATDATMIAPCAHASVGCAQTAS